jgi:dTDP-4-dehydrorhamnose reductase
MIHVNDLYQVIKEVVFNRSEKRYHLLSDVSQTTQYEWVKTIADAVGSGNVKLMSRE